MGLFKGFFKMNKYRIEIFFLLFFFSSFSFALDCNTIQFNSLTPVTKYCVGQEVNLTTELKNTDDGTVSYKWYALGSSTPIPNETNSSLKISNIDISKKGKYKCEVTVTKGALICNKNLEFDVDVIEKFTFDLGADKTMCPGTSTIELKPTIQNSNSSITYSWTSSPSGITGTSKDINVNATSIATESTLTLTAKAGNCEFSDNVKIANVSNFTVSAGTDQTVCKGDNVNLSATVSNTNGFPVNYNWTGPGGFATNGQSVLINNISIKSLFVLEATINNCKINDNVEVLIPDFTITSPMFDNTNTQLVYCLQSTDEKNGTIGFNYTLPSDLNLIQSLSTDWGDGTIISVLPQDYSKMQFHNYLPGSYNMKLSLKLKNGCNLDLNYSVFVGSSPSPAALQLFINQANGCAPHITEYNFSVPSDNVNGTQYIVNWGDGSPSETYIHPITPPTLKHTFTESSCGKTVTLNNITYNNVYQPSVITQNPCSIQPQPSAAGLISVGTPPKPMFDIDKEIQCINKTVKVTNNSDFGLTIVPGSALCNKTAPFYWEVKNISKPLLTSWNISNGSLGSSNNMTNHLFWTNGSSNFDINFIEPGVYSIELFIKNNCGLRSIKRTVKIEGPPIPKFILSKNYGCVGLQTNTTNQSDLTNSFSSSLNWVAIFNNSVCGEQNGNFEFINSTSNTSNEANFKFNDRGNYTVRLSINNSCGIFSYDQTLKVLGLPNASIPVIDSICQNGTVSPTLNVNACDNTINGYSWVFTDGTPSTSILPSPGIIKYTSFGLKTLQVVVKSGCGDVTASQSVYVKPLPPVLSPKINNQSSTVTVCIGDNANFTSNTITQSPAVYSWSGPNGFVKSDQNFTLPINSTNQEGTYKILGTMNGCVGPEETINLVVKTKPTLTIATASSEICKNTSTSLNASGSTTNTNNPTWTYSWSPSLGLSSTVGGTVSANPTTTTTYTLTGSDGICSNTKTVLLTVKELPVINNSSNEQSVCSESTTSRVNWSSTLTSSFTWSMVSNPGNITGFIATGTDFLPPMTLINPTTTTQVIKYSIIPKSNNCDGAAFEYSITVKPKPILTIAPITKSTICGGDKVIVPVFSSSVIGSDYSWNLTQPNPFPSTITGISSNHSGTGQMPELTINNNGSAPVIFTYSINAKMDECISIPKTFSFTINPAPSISEPFSSKQEICSESSTVEVPFSTLTNNEYLQTGPEYWFLVIFGNCVIVLISKLQ